MTSPQSPIMSFKLARSKYKIDYEGHHVDGGGGGRRSRSRSRRKRVLAVMVGLNPHTLSASTTSFETFTNRTPWESAVDSRFLKETFNSFETDLPFDDGETVDLGLFSLTGFGHWEDNKHGNETWNRVDAKPFSPTRPSLDGTTNLVVRVCESEGNMNCHQGFDIRFVEPQRAWGANFGRTGSSFRVSVGGAVVGSAVNDGFFGFVDVHGGSFTEVRIDTEKGWGGANTNLDDFVSAPVDYDSVAQEPPPPFDGAEVDKEVIIAEYSSKVPGLGELKSKPPDVQHETAPPPEGPSYKYQNFVLLVSLAANVILLVALVWTKFDRRQTKPFERVEKNSPGELDLEEDAFEHGNGDGYKGINGSGSISLT